MGNDKADIRIVAAVTFCTMLAAILIGLAVGKLWVGRSTSAPASAATAVEIEQGEVGYEPVETGRSDQGEADEDEERATRPSWLERVDGAERLEAFTNAELSSLASELSSWLSGQARDFSTTEFECPKDPEEVQIHEGDTARVVYLRVKGVQLWATCQLERGSWSVTKLGQVIEGVNDDAVREQTSASDKSERESRVTNCFLDDTRTLEGKLGKEGAANLQKMWSEWAAQAEPEIASSTAEGDYVMAELGSFSTSGTVTSFEIRAYHEGSQIAAFDAQYDSSDNSYAFGRR